MNKIETLPFETAVLEVIKDMVFIVAVSNDSNFIYTFFNRAVSERTHLNVGDIGKRFFEAHDEKTADLLEKHYKNVLETLEEHVFEDTHISPAGESYYSETTLTPLFDSKRKCTHIVGVVKDITKERLANLASMEAWERLKESRSRYRSLYKNNTDAIFSLDLQEQILGGNSTVEKLTNCHLNDLIGTEFTDHFLQSDKEILKTYFNLAQVGISQDVRTKFTGKEGQSAAVLIHFAPVEVKGEIVGIYATLKDMTELDQMASQYLDSENRFKIIAENSHDVIVLMNAEGETTYVSPSSSRVYGITPAEYMGKTPFHNVHPDDVVAVRKAYSRAIDEARTYILEIRLQHKTQEWIWAEVQGTPIFNEKNEFSYMLTITQDITLHKERETQLHYYAYHDSLTGLPNRRLLKERLTEKLNEPTAEQDIMTVILLDIDHFKEINDQYGHDVGDAVIKEFGRRLLKIINPEDIAARLGGDEFILVLPNVKTVEQAEIIAEEIQQIMAHSWEEEADVLKVTTSMGVNITSRQGETTSTVLKKADSAMYRSKESGRNSYTINYQ